MSTKFVLKQNNSNGRKTNGSSPVEYAFDGSMFTLGSDATNNLILKESAAEQAVIVREGEQLTLINSADGTQLNGKSLRREAIHPLGDGDEILIGNHTIMVIDGDEDFARDETAAVSSAASEILKSIEAAPAATATARGLAMPADDSSLIETNGFPIIDKKTAPPANPNGQIKSSNNFAAVLDTLRTEEDSFYFVVKSVVGNKETEVARIALEQAEIPIGANENNEIVFDIKLMTTVFGVIRKDWSGIILETSRRGAVFVNNEALDAAARRLRNDDRVNFAAPVESTLVLHEPSLLVALEPLLSARAVAAADNAGSGDNTKKNQIAATNKASKPKLPLLERTFFNNFSFVEILTFVIGTLIGAVLFFLFFEFIFS